MLKLATLIAVLTLGIIAPSHAQEKPLEEPWQLLPVYINCHTNEVVENVLRKYEEVPFAQGKGSLIVPGNRMYDGQMQMYVHPDGNSYTIAITLTEEYKCIVVMGKDFTPWFGEKTPL